MRNDKTVYTGNSVVCYECGERYTGKTVGCHTCYQDTCDICGKENICTQLRDFRDPVAKVEKE